MLTDELVCFVTLLPLPQSAPAPSLDLTSHVGANDASAIHSSSTSPTTSIASDMREINRPKTGSNVSKMKVGTIRFARENAILSLV